MKTERKKYTREEVHRGLTGDTEMMDEIFWNTISDDLRRLMIERRGGDLRMDAEDAIQDSLTQWYVEERGKDRQVKNERAYVKRIAQNKFIESQRKKKENELGERVKASRESNPAWIVEQDERIEEIMGAVNKLPETHKETMLLRIGGYSYDEISEKTGTEKNTLYKRMHDARDILGRRLLNGE